MVSPPVDGSVRFGSAVSMGGRANVYGTEQTETLAGTTISGRIASSMKGVAKAGSSHKK